MSFCENYIQLVWAVTSYVGCSLYDQASCGGNLTEIPYTTGAACSGCTGSWAGCENDLCIRTQSAAAIPKMMLLLLIASLLAIMLASM